LALKRLACAASQRMVSGPRHETTQGRPATAIRIPGALCGAPSVKIKILSTKKKGLDASTDRGLTESSGEVFLLDLLSHRMSEIGGHQTASGVLFTKAENVAVRILDIKIEACRSGGELAESLRAGFPGAIVDLVLNFTPGLIAGLFLRWKPLAAVLLGGMTYVSSSGVIAKVLADLR